jgi:LDH2 family malate/lactate/ureidoglycolate dehydrogenase
MATATVALGKITPARKQRRRHSPDRDIDQDGIPTTGPRQVVTLMSIVDMKVAGLSLMIEGIESVRPFV